MKEEYLHVYAIKFCIVLFPIFIIKIIILFFIRFFFFTVNWLDWLNIWKSYNSEFILFFSFHEIETKDLPAIFNYIFDYTEHLYYIGHSMGTISLFTFLSTKTKPEYNIKIKIAICLVVYLAICLRLFLDGHLHLMKYLINCQHCSNFENKRNFLLHKQWYLKYSRRLNNYLFILHLMC